MNIKKLNEQIEKLLEVDYKFADFDADTLYKFVPESRGSITFEEVDKIKELIGITGNETPEQLRAIRNTIVKYRADRAEYDKAQAEHDWEVEKATNPNANLSEFRKNCTYDIRQDQMSAFVHVIDMELYK